MVDEKEEHYEEEGEYHFSDDQVNYDVEPEAATAKASSSLNKESVLNKFSQHRRRILGVVSILVLIGVVYKILVPSTPTAPITEFNQATAAMKGAPAVTTQTKVTKVETKTAVQSVAPITPTTAVVTAATPQPGQPASTYTQQTQEPVVVVAAPSSPMNAVSTTPSGATVPAMGMPATTTQTQSTVTSTMPSAMTAANQMNAVQSTTIDPQIKDRISTLEQQNTAMMNLLQTEYAQKIADAETQSTVVRGKMEELTKRINRMESSLNQITQMLQGMGRSQASIESPTAATYNPASRAGEPRMTYTVQAIIPGRAWLKSESGDTVTVAEGDYLKKYGRVTKIDPYDGIVSIDTGTKVITLAYGLDGG